jgi:hypothetical protein
MQSAPIQRTQVPPKPTCTPKFNTGSCSDLWKNYNQAVQRSALNKLTTDQQQAQQAQIKKLNDQIQADATAALQAKSDYASALVQAKSDYASALVQAKSSYAIAVVQAKTAAHTQGLREGAGVGLGVTLVVFALRLGLKTLVRNFTATKKPKARAASV